MYEHILVPTDGSDAAATAAQTGFALARRFDATLHAVHVVEETTDAAYGEDVVAAIEAAADEVDVETTSAVLTSDGDVPETLIEYAATGDIDCIVMGAHGQQSVRERLLGSVASRTLRVAPVPVITVHEETAVTDEIDQLLVPTDGSEAASAAVDHALDFATATGASLHTIHVVEDSDSGDEETVLDALEAAGKRAVENVIDRAQRAGIASVESAVVSDVPDRAIEAYVQEKDIDYVVMGTHGRTGVSEQLLGSTTERVVRLLDVPVVSVRPTDSDD